MSVSRGGKRPAVRPSCGPHDLGSIIVRPCSGRGVRHRFSKVRKPSLIRGSMMNGPLELVIASERHDWNRDCQRGRRHEVKVTSDQPRAVASSFLGPRTSLNQAQSVIPRCCISAFTASTAAVRSRSYTSYHLAWRRSSGQAVSSRRTDASVVASAVPSRIINRNAARRSKSVTCTGSFMRWHLGDSHHRARAAAGYAVPCCTSLPS